MAGKFVNTKYQDTVQSLVDGVKDKINSPFYQYNNEKPTIVTYYNINRKKSCVDEGTGMAYANIGDKSSLKYNKIDKMILYGLDKIEVQLENGEWGVESGPIEGSAIVIPNTIVPCPDDFFTIDYLKDKILFKVTDVTNDTVDNNNNFYRISYKLDKLTDEKINKQVVDEYKLMIENQGSDFNCIIRKNDYDLVTILDDINVKLIEYYNDLFYSSRVQTYILMYNSERFYDPYLIEFIIKNKILYNENKYMYITQQIALPATFGINYDKTFFRYFENPYKKPLSKYYINSQASCIDQHLSILSTRIERYFEIKYNDKLLSQSPSVFSVIDNLDIDLYEHILDNKLYEEDEKKYRNIIINYCNNEEFTLSKNDILCIDDIEFSNDITLFYEIPILIFIIDKCIKKLMSVTFQ